jgi:HSP20 family molecular chaperone IbpA
MPFIWHLISLAGMRSPQKSREEMDRLFDSPFGSFLRSPASLRSWSPPLDVYQDKDNFTIVVDLPGLKKENIDISLRGETLTISGERKAEEGRTGFTRRAILRQLSADSETSNPSRSEQSESILPGRHPQSLASKS